MAEQINNDGPNSVRFYLMAFDSPCKVVHASREIQNKISRSRKSPNSNSRGRKMDLYQESRITEK